MWGGGGGFAVRCSCSCSRSCCRHTVSLTPAPAIVATAVASAAAAPTPVFALIRTFVRANPHYPVTLVCTRFVPAGLFDLLSGSFMLVHAIWDFGGALCVLSSLSFMSTSNFTKLINTWVKKLTFIAWIMNLHKIYWLVLVYITITYLVLEVGWEWEWEERAVWW